MRVHHPHTLHMLSHQCVHHNYSPLLPPRAPSSPILPPRAPQSLGLAPTASEEAGWPWVRQGRRMEEQLHQGATPSSTCCTCSSIAQPFCSARLHLYIFTKVLCARFDSCEKRVAMREKRVRIRELRVAIRERWQTGLLGDSMRCGGDSMRCGHGGV